jgi:hypothetical protein
MQVIEQFVRADGGGIDSLNIEELGGGYISAPKKDLFILVISGLARSGLLQDRPL